MVTALPKVAAHLDAVEVMPGESGPSDGAPINARLNVSVSMVLGIPIPTTSPFTRGTGAM